MTMCNGSWVEIHVDRVCRNAQAIQHALGGTRLIAVVKSDAYGHGLGPVAEALGRAGVRDFAVAYSAEASVVRSAVPQAERILVLGTAFAEDLPRLLQDGITPMVVSLEQAVQLSDAAWAAGRKTLPVHIKLDTGMGRLGFICPAELDQAAEVLQLPGLHVEGLCTHFAMVEPKRRPEAAQQQAQRFQQAAAVLEEQAGRRLFRHISSSRAALLAPDFDQDGARVGISLYGYGSADPGQRFFSRPVLQWKSKVMQVKTLPAGYPVGYYATYTTPSDTEVAIISCGYTDGYLRHLGNKGHVLIGGRRRRVVGRVSMNWIAAELERDSGVKAGDEVVLIGEQGGEQIWADELAAHCGTIAYEILTGISRQIERRYIRA